MPHLAVAATISESWSDWIGRHREQERGNHESATTLGTLWACALFGFTAPACASTIIYDTFLPDTQWSSGGFAVGNGPGYEIGVSFVPFSSGYLTEIWLAASASTTNPGNMDVNLWADDNGRPGELLWQTPVIDELELNETIPLVLSAPGTLFLSSTERYWLTFAPYADNYVVWHNMNLAFDDLPDFLGQGIARAPDFNDGNWFISFGNNDNVFRIYAETVSVPAPPTLLLVLLGLGALAFARRNPTRRGLP